MFKQAAFAALAATAFVATPASAAHIVYGNPTPDSDSDGSGNITLTPAGPGAESSALSFDVTAPGNFTATFEFVNPFSPATAGGSAVFNFDGDIVTFTGASISGGGTFTTTSGPLGSSIQVDRFGLGAGPQTLTFSGTLNPSGNGFARIGGQLTLTAVPEPATWALFILGFGMVGAALRRRSGAVRVSKAKLHFA